MGVHGGCPWHPREIAHGIPGGRFGPMGILYPAALWDLGTYARNFVKSFKHCFRKREND